VAGNRIRIICQTRQITLRNFVKTRIDRALYSVPHIFLNIVECK